MPTDSRSAGLTELTPRAASAGELLPQVYERLRNLARSYMKSERAGHTLQPTALIHEAYLRLAQQERVAWQSRSHFLAAAAQAMRRILVDHARGKARLKRGGALARLPLEDLALAPNAGDQELVQLDEALDRLAEINQEHAQVVELRFFGGMTVPETAEALGVSTSSVERAWRAARAWLYRELTKH